MKRNVIAGLSLIGVGIVLGIMLVHYFGLDNRLSLFAKEKIGADAPPIKLPESVAAMNEAFVNVSNAVLPTVVSINVIVEEKKSQNPFREQWKEFFEFFGDIPFDNSPHKMEGSGSGVLVTKNGYIVTNNHVVDGATEINVTTYDKKKYKAKLKDLLI